MIMNRGLMLSDRDFWLLVRAALIQIVKAIEKRWLCKDVPDPEHDCLHEPGNVV